MNLHKNARLTEAGRALLVDRIKSGWPVGAGAAGRLEAARLGVTWIRWSAGRAEEFQAPAASVDLVTVGEASTSRPRGPGRWTT